MIKIVCCRCRGPGFSFQRACASCSTSVVWSWVLPCFIQYELVMPMLSISHAHHQMRWSTYRRKTNPSFKVKSSLCLLAVSIKPPFLHWQHSRQIFLDPRASLNAGPHNEKVLGKDAGMVWGNTENVQNGALWWGGNDAFVFTTTPSLGHSCSPPFRESHLKYDKHQICSFYIRSWIVSTFV